MAIQASPSNNGRLPAKVTDPFPSRPNVSDRLRWAASACRCSRRSLVSSACSGATCASTCGAAFASRSVSMPGAMPSSSVSAFARWPSSSPSSPPSTVPIARAWLTLMRPAAAAAATSGCSARSRAWCRSPDASRFDNPPSIASHELVGVPDCCIDSWVASAFASSTAASAVSRDANPRACCAQASRSPRSTCATSNASRMPSIDVNARDAGDS